MINLKKYTISVVGLGYVGLPLAIEFGKKTKVIGLIGSISSRRHQLLLQNLSDNLIKNL